MANGTAVKSLSQSQKYAIKKYVDEIVNHKLRVFEEYLDVDKGLELRPEVKKRLSKKNSNEKKISHEEFWLKAFKK